jgi:predicted membrane protein
MPAYDDSFLGQLSPYTTYIFIILWYIVCLLGLLCVITVVALPFVMAFYGYKSIKLKIKKKKSHKLDKQKKSNQEFYEQRYIDRLHKNIKRKRHK